MLTSSQITPGMALSVGKKFYRVETVVKVTVPKGTPFIKTTLRDLSNNKVVEKNFKPNQSIKPLPLEEHQLEYLYMEGRDFLFLDIDKIEQLLIPHQIIGEQAHYLKEGVALKAFFHGQTVFSVELPQFLELMITEEKEGEETLSGGAKIVYLETGAQIEVPSFIEVGDIIKVDTKTNEYIQRV